MTFTKEQLQHIIETDHVQCGDASALARMALAGMEAEPVAWAHRLINKRNGVVHPWVYGSAEACPSEGDIFNIEVMPLYTAPPAPVSVTDIKWPEEKFCPAEYAGSQLWEETEILNKAIDACKAACRAAMLQGAEPVSKRDELPEGWVACSERMPEQFVEALVCTEDGSRYVAALNQSMNWDDGDFFDDIQYVTHWMPLPAAPQQEVKP